MPLFSRAPGRARFAVLGVPPLRLIEAAGWPKSYAPASRFVSVIRCMKEDARPMTAAQAPARRGWVGIEDRQLKRKTMYWLFWFFLVGSLLISVTHTALS